MKENDARKEVREGDAEEGVEEGVLERKGRQKTKAD